MCVRVRLHGHHGYNLIRDVQWAETIAVVEVYSTVRDRVKGVHCLCVRAKKNTFVIFYFPSFAITILLFPINILRNSEERLFLFTLDTLHNRCNKLF